MQAQQQQILRAGFLIVVAVCAGFMGTDLWAETIPSDKSLFENGMALLDKGHYKESRLSLQTLISTYPESAYTPACFVSIADSYYEEGGEENLLQAKLQYKDFIIFYPNNEMVDHAQTRIATINRQLKIPHDRHPTYLRDAEIELKKFLEDFPDSELAPAAKELLRQVQENLSK